MVAWRRNGCVLILACALAATSATTALAAAGDLDSSFGTSGKVTTDFTAKNDFASGVAIRPDGRIVTAGRAGGRGGQFAVARYNVNGHLDITFSGDGRAVANFTRQNDLAYGVAVMSKGRIVAAGRAGGKGGQFALVRFRRNGYLDPTFGGDGKVVTNFTRKNDLAFGVAIQSDGKIVVAGEAGNPAKFALARYNANGHLDTTFSGDGKVITNLTPAADAARGVRIQSDGKIVVAGQAGAPANFALARYNADGTLDATFGSGGIVITNVNNTDSNAAHGLAIQTDGKIVAAGFDLINGPPTVRKFALARYNSDGTLDSTFESGDGMLDTKLTGDDVAFGVAIQSDGKIVAVGRASSRFGVARYNSDGSRDLSFSGNGDTTTDFSAGIDAAHGLAIQGDGKIVAAGSSNNQGTFALARYLDV
jgi:uncharacterized delta-60 repeat protein